MKGREKRKEGRSEVAEKKEVDQRALGKGRDRGEAIRPPLEGASARCGAST